MIALERKYYFLPLYEESKYVRTVSRVVEERDVNTHDIWNPAGSGDSDSDADAGNNGGSGVIIFDD